MLHAKTVVASQNNLSFSIRVFEQDYSALFDNDDGDYQRQKESYKDGAWNGKNGGSDTRFSSSSGQQLAFSGAYQYGDFYTGLNIQRSEERRVGKECRL